MRRPGRPEADRRRGPSADDGVLPLINVVFLLLIFFMIAGQIAQGEPFAIDPARSTSEGVAQEGPVLLVGGDGRLAYDGAEAGLDAVLAAVAAAPPAVLRVRADGGAETGAVIALLTALRGAGAQDIRLITDRAP
jgi:biopolymer transport protein ExbD